MKDELLPAIRTDVIRDLAALPTGRRMKAQVDDALLACADEIDRLAHDVARQMAIANAEINARLSSTPEPSGDDVERVARAIMKNDGCGLTIDEQHVLCCDESVKGHDDPYGDPLYRAPADCSCWTNAKAAIAAMGERERILIPSPDGSTVTNPTPQGGTDGNEGT